MKETSSEEAERVEYNNQIAEGIWELTEIVLDVLFKSYERIPLCLRRVASDVQRIGGEKFDESLVLAGFFILRFVAPAIAAPESFQLECVQKAALSPENKKKLVQVSKVVQAVANNQPFKESSHLDSLNKRVSEANTRLKTFFASFKNDKACVDDSIQETDEEMFWRTHKDYKTLDPQIMSSCWTLCIRNLPDLALHALDSQDEKERKTFAVLVDVLSGLPMSSK